MNSYVDQNLNTGESVRYRMRLHWSVFLWPSVFALFFLVPGLLNLVLGAATHGGGLATVGLVMTVVGLIPLAVAYLRQASAEFAVTNKRVIVKVGVFQRRTAEMFLTKVESIGVTQNPLGRMLNYGTIVVPGTGGTPEPFVKVAHPLEFRRQVQDHRREVESCALDRLDDVTVSSCILNQGRDKPSNRFQALASHYGKIRKACIVLRSDGYIVFSSHS